MPTGDRPTGRIAVIGGGIAGAAACLRLQNHGLQPLWIAPELSGRDKPGEHLAPAARPLLQQLRAHHLLEAPCHRAANTLFSSWGSDALAERHAAVHLEGPGTVLDRPRFEAGLRALAQQRGALSNTHPLQTAEHNGEHWRLDLGDRRETADFLIDASGRHAVIAKRQAKRFRSDQLIAAVSFLEQDPESPVTPTPATLIEAVADGWWYAALLADGRLVLNFFSDGQCLPDGLSRNTDVWQHLIKGSTHIQRWIREAAFQITHPPVLNSAGTTWIAPAAGDAWLAVGDASAAFDPLSSHGMTTALWSAIQGADAAVEALCGNSSKLHRYADAVAQGVHEFLQARNRIYAQELRFKDQDFWSRRIQNIPAEGVTDTGM